MNKIYDILLNFNDKLFDIYEWEEKDDIIHIRKIPLFKVSSTIMHDFIDNTIALKLDFLNLIHNKTEYYHKNKIYFKEYAFLLTDGKVVIGFESDGKSIKKYSKLLYDDEDDIINDIEDMVPTNIEYSIIECKNSVLKTRNEDSIKKYITRQIKYYINNNEDVLHYIYLEYFHEDVVDVKESIFKDINKNWNDVYIDIYNFLKKLPLNH